MLVSRKFVNSSNLFKLFNCKGLYFGSYNSEFSKEDFQSTLDTDKDSTVKSEDTCKELVVVKDTCKELVAIKNIDVYKKKEVIYFYDI